jgi:hypothetical protein
MPIGALDFINFPILIGVSIDTEGHFSSKHKGNDFKHCCFLFKKMIKIFLTYATKQEALASFKKRD